MQLRGSCSAVPAGRHGIRARATPGLAGSSGNYFSNESLAGMDDIEALNFFDCENCGTGKIKGKGNWTLLVPYAIRDCSRFQAESELVVSFAVCPTTCKNEGVLLWPEFQYLRE